MAETSKAKPRRDRTGWFGKYIRYPGIDIGAGNDPVDPGFRLYDMSRGDGNAQTMAEVPDNLFATVYASHVLEHMHNPAEAIRNWFRILAPGGYLIIQVPHMNLYEKRTELPSRWNADHKTYWLPSGGPISALHGCGPHVRGLGWEVTQVLPTGEYESVYLETLDEGYTANGDGHPGGEYSIEICIRKLPDEGTKTVLVTPEVDEERAGTDADIRDRVRTLRKDNEAREAERKSRRGRGKK